jgi:hypothetical protein
MNAKGAHSRNSLQIFIAQPAAPRPATTGNPMCPRAPELMEPIR